MDFDYSEKVQGLREELMRFMDEFVYPNEKTFEEQLNEAETRWSTPPIMEELKEKARAARLWNLFLPDSELGAGLTNLDTRPCARSWAVVPSLPRSSTARPPTPETKKERKWSTVAEEAKSK